MIAVRQTRLCLWSQLLKGPVLAALNLLQVFFPVEKVLEGNTVINNAKKNLYSRKTEYLAFCLHPPAKIVMRCMLSHMLPKNGA